MILAYRLHDKRYPANSSLGAKLFGGRWNPLGVGVVYASSSPSLSVLEILTQYSELPLDYVLTEIEIPEEVDIEIVKDENLPADWQEEPPVDVKARPYSAAQRYGELWLMTRRSTILSVPSAVMGLGCATERVLVINPELPAFNAINFRPSLPFRIDPRLKR